MELGITADAGEFLGNLGIEATRASELVVSGIS
jgi:hypothetical protein